LKVKEIYDTLEDATLEIEALKDELSSIVMTRTGTGVNARDRWDTPETKTQDGKKGRSRKDRYSALVMANYIARRLQREVAPVEYNVIGGFTNQIVDKMKNNRTEDKDGKVKAEPMYYGPDWFTKVVGTGHSFGVIRRQGV